MARPGDTVGYGRTFTATQETRIATVPIGFGYLTIPSPELAAAALAPVVFTMAMPFGVSAAAIQEVVPQNMRAQASSKPERSR